tara:strand:- start:2027 stop:2320 length:294 start_codon:yes stop_codon:yes gene_type:complete
MAAKKKKRKPDYLFTNGNDREFQFYFRKPHKNHNADGLCLNPDVYEDPKIYVDPHLPPKRKLQVVIEEVTHAFFWDKTEKDVRKFSQVLADILVKKM